MSADVHSNQLAERAVIVRAEPVALGREEAAAMLGVEPFDVHRSHVEAFARQLEDRGQSKSTVARKLSSLSSYYRYAFDEGLVARSPVSGVRRPRLSGESPSTGLDQVELRALLGAAARSSDRSYALVLLLALNGLRVSEAIGLDVGDLSSERGHKTVSITRKGGKRQTVPLAPVTWEAVTRLVGERSEGPLFVTQKGNRLTRGLALRQVVKLSARAGIKRVTPHDLRHTFCTLALEAGVDLWQVQDAAGHADPRTTMRYNHARNSLDNHPTYALAGRLL